MIISFKEDVDITDISVYPQTEILATPLRKHWSECQQSHWSSESREKFLHRWNYALNYCDIDDIAPWFSSETLARYKSLTYLLTYLIKHFSSHSAEAVSIWPLIGRRGSRTKKIRSESEAGRRDCFFSQRSSVLSVPSLDLRDKPANRMKQNFLA